MDFVITSEELQAKIDKLEGRIKSVIAKRAEMETELKIYRTLRHEASSRNGTGVVLPSASDAIMALLDGREATTTEMVDALQGSFSTKSQEPRTAIYAAVDALKKRQLIEPCPGDGRRYRLVQREDTE